jgi:uncharacterized protein (TIGR02646 family)
MRKVNNDFNNAPAELVNCAKKHEQNLLQNRNINADCYKKSREPLEKQFHNKCAYCESSYDATSDTWTEHYRPKKAVAEVPNHPGYYWLAYEWSNLLPSCTKCNRSKRNQFPLINNFNQVKKPEIKDNQLVIAKCKADQSPLIDEKPFVLHPKIDNPEEFLDFRIDNEFKGIIITGKDTISDNEKYSGRGEATIKICNLNRPALKRERFEKVIYDYSQKFIQILQILNDSGTDITNYYSAFKVVFNQLKQLTDDEKLEHTLLRRAVMKPDSFRKMIIPVFENKQIGKIVFAAFKKYLQETDKL